MIRTHSKDPDIVTAAARATAIIRDTLVTLPKAETFDYGGHELRVGEYDVCAECTVSIAEAQQAERHLAVAAEATEDPTVKEHIELAANLLRLEAEAAEIRTQLHGGQGSEPIVNELLGFIHERHIHDRFGHQHHDTEAQES